MSFSSIEDIGGIEGRHRMYALGEMFGWDIDFPVMVIQDADASKTIGELLQESLREAFELTEPERRDYLVKLARLAGTQPILRSNGVFEFYNISSADAMRLVDALRRTSWVEWVQQTSGRYEFGNWSRTIANGGIPPRYQNICGRIKLN